MPEPCMPQAENLGFGGALSMDEKIENIGEVLSLDMVPCVPR